MGAWVPGRAVPWGLGRLPWAPGAPPRGSQGGVPAPNYKGQSPLSTLWIRIKIYIDFDIDFWSSWGRSWVPLGGHFRSCWRLFRPKLVSEPSSNQLIFENMTFLTKHCVFHFFFYAQIDPKMDPRSTPKRSKIDIKIDIIFDANLKGRGTEVGGSGRT